MYRRVVVFLVVLVLAWGASAVAAAQPMISNNLTDWNPAVIPGTLVKLEYATLPPAEIIVGAIVPMSLKVTREYGFPPGGYPYAGLVLQITEAGMPVGPEAVALGSELTWVWDQDYRWFRASVPITETSPPTIDFTLSLTRIGGFNVALSLWDFHP